MSEPIKLDEEDSKKYSELIIQSRVIQSQLEGCFRQLFQGAQQQALVGGNFGMYEQIFTVAKEFMGQLGDIVFQAGQLGVKDKQGESTNSRLPQ